MHRTLRPGNPLHEGLVLSWPLRRLGQDTINTTRRQRAHAAVSNVAAVTPSRHRVDYRKS